MGKKQPNRRKNHFGTEPKRYAPKLPYRWMWDSQWYLVCEYCPDCRMDSDCLVGNCRHFFVDSLHNDCYYFLSALQQKISGKAVYRWAAKGNRTGKTCEWGKNEISFSHEPRYPHADERNYRFFRPFGKAFTGWKKGLCVFEKAAILRQPPNDNHQSGFGDCPHRKRNSHPAIRGRGYGGTVPLFVYCFWIGYSKEGTSLFRRNPYPA